MGHYSHKAKRLPCKTNHRPGRLAGIASAPVGLSENPAKLPVAFFQFVILQIKGNGANQRIPQHDGKFKHGRALLLPLCGSVFQKRRGFFFRFVREKDHVPCENRIRGINANRIEICRAKRAQQETLRFQLTAQGTPSLSPVMCLFYIFWFCSGIP